MLILAKGKVLSSSDNLSYLNSCFHSQWCYPISELGKCTSVGPRQYTLQIVFSFMYLLEFSVCLQFVTAGVISFRGSI